MVSQSDDRCQHISQTGQSSSDNLEDVIPESTMAVRQDNMNLQIEIDVSRKTGETNRQMAAIVEGSDDAIISKTLDGIITCWNMAAEVLYGYTAAEAVGQQSISLHIPPEHLDEIPDLLERIGRSESISSHETTYRRKDGNDICVSLTISPVRNNAGTIVGTSTIARDITTQVRVRKEREKLIAELQEALAKFKTWQGLFHICAWCKKIRDDQGYWQQIEAYIHDHSEAFFSHGICPDCVRKAQAQMQKD